MIPIDPRIAASSLYQSAGMSSQSATRRYWMNRFRFGSSRTMPSGLASSPQPGANDGLNMTGPGGIPWNENSQHYPAINPLAPVLPQAPQFGVPQDAMGIDRYLPGVGPRPLTPPPDEGAGQIPHIYQEPARGTAPTYEESAAGQAVEDIKRYGPTEGKSAMDYQTKINR